MVHFEFDVGRVLDVEQLLVAGVGLGGPDADERAVVLQEVDGLVVDLVGEHQVGRPELVRTQLDHVVATPGQRVPGQLM